MARRFTSALGYLVNHPGSIAFRKGWSGVSYITVGWIRHEMCLMRSDGEALRPYTPQQDDMFSSDWEVEDAEL